MTKEQLLKAIKGHRLYKLYHSPTNEIPRGDLEGEVNPSGQATDRLFDLKKRIREVVMMQTDFPKEMLRDADDLQGLVQSTIVTLYSDSDGQIPNADFRRFFDPLAGMVEGLLGALNADDPELAADMHRIKTECRHKAFMQQLKKLVESDDSDAPKLGKALSSMLTHVWILAEKTSKGVNDKLVGKLTSMVEELKSPEAVPGVLAQVKAWGLFEDVMTPVKVDQKIPPNKDSKQPGLDSTNKDASTTTKGQPTGDERWDGKKDGKGAKAETKPNLLIQAPGNPEDDVEGDEPGQDVGDLDKGLPATIDGQPLKPDEKKTPATKESVELHIVEETQSRVLYDIHYAGQSVGSATLNRCSRSRKIKGCLEDAKKAFEARSPAHAKLIVFKLLATA